MRRRHRLQVPHRWSPAALLHRAVDASRHIDRIRWPVSFGMCLGPPDRPVLSLKVWNLRGFIPEAWKAVLSGAADRPSPEKSRPSKRIDPVAMDFRPDQGLLPPVSPERKRMRGDKAMGTNCGATAPTPINSPMLE